MQNFTRETKQTKRADKGGVNYWCAPSKSTENIFAKRLELPAAPGAFLRFVMIIKGLGMFSHERRQCRTSFRLTEAEGSTGGVFFLKTVKCEAAELNTLTNLDWNFRHRFYTLCPSAWILGVLPKSGWLSTHLGFSRAGTLLKHKPALLHMLLQHLRAGLEREQPNQRENLGQTM